MKKKTLIIYLSGLALALNGCVNEEIFKTDEAGKPITAVLSVSFPGAQDITVTKTPYDHSLISEVCLFVFSGNTFEQTEEFTMDNHEGNLKDNIRTFELKFQTTSGSKNICAIANYNIDDSRWVPYINDLKNDVENGSLDYDALCQHIISLRNIYPEEGYTPVYAEDYMPLSGKGNFTFNTGGKADKELDLKRTMAQIRFNIKNGTNENKINFEAATYRIYNLPKCTYLTDGNNTPIGYEKDENGYPNYYTGILNNIPPASEGKYSFSFYMPENIQDSDYQNKTADDRELWYGTPGSAPNEKHYTNAPEYATFVVIEGNYTEIGPDNKLVYSGDVSYTIHLGDFSNQDYNNFTIRRNTRYTYNITVNGVNSITTEATTESPDNVQQGAEGNILSMDEFTRSYTLDAHYEQVFLEYNLSSVAAAVENATDKAQAIGERMMLIVETPFMANREQILPYKIYNDAISNNTDPKDAKKGKTENIDYKWVEFYPQTENYIHSYPGLPEWKTGGTDIRPESEENEKLIDVYDACVGMGLAIRDILEGKITPGDNIKQYEGISVCEYGGKYYARFTGFVDEFFYTEDPLTGEKITWGDFVNTDSRTMMVSMEVKTSADGNSTLSTLHSNITQRSIQTPYDLENAENLNAIGLEIFNESTTHSYGTWEGGDSEAYGRINIVNSGIQNQNWSNYVNEQQNGYHNTNTTNTHSGAHKENALAACLARNRDLNGNGIIENDEIRWYLPAINEYLRLGIGQSFISNESRFYQGDKMEMTKSGYPTSYIEDGALYFSSTKGKRVYWAVEKGASGNKVEDGGLFRCVRILPHDLKNPDEVKESTAIYKLRRKDTGNGTTYILDYRDIFNPNAYRAVRTNTNFGYHDEDDDANKLFIGTVVAKNFLPGDYTLYEIVNQSGNSNPCASYSESWTNDNVSQNGTGRWRVPNLSELTIMASMPGYFMNSNPMNNNPNSQGDMNIAACTHFSNTGVRLGFAFESQYTGQYIYAPGDKDDQTFESLKFPVRCVRDVVNEEEIESATLVD